MGRHMPQVPTPLGAGECGSAAERAQVGGGGRSRQAGLWAGAAASRTAGLPGRGATWRATLVEILEKSASVSTWMLYSARMGRLYMVA